MHSGEAEIVAAATSATHVIYWKNLLAFMLNTFVSSCLHTDSTTCKSFLTMPLHTSTMKHINLKLLFVREHVFAFHSASHFLVVYIAGDYNPADMNTKPLSSERLNYLLQQFRRWGGGQPQPQHDTAGAGAGAGDGRTPSFSSMKSTSTGAESSKPTSSILKNPSPHGKHAKLDPSL